MKLNELLSTKKFKIVDSDEDADTLAYTAEIGKRTIRYYAETYKKGSTNFVYIEFAEILRGTGRHSFKATGSGAEFQVFAFVKWCIEQTMKKWSDAEVIKFSAAKMEGLEVSRRPEVYEKLFKKFLKGWKITKEVSGKEVEFTIEKEHGTA